MKKLVIIAQVKTAMPGICDVTDFGLTDEKKNKKILKNLLTKKKETFWGTETHELFRTGAWDGSGYILLQNKRENLISYIVKYEMKNGVMNFKKVIVQVKVWRSLKDPAVSGLAKKIFFGILLPKYGAIMSDMLQTRDGQRFWIDNMTQADARGYQVAYVDRNQRKVVIHPKDISMYDWIDSFHTWEDETKNDGEKFLIFKG
jgi:hypothetical protein